MINTQADELDATRRGKRPVSRHTTIRLTAAQIAVLREFSAGTKAVRIEDVRTVVEAVLHGR
jgi:hypothetical protein